eukprot:178922-Rhodomonas_salina.2
MLRCGWRQGDILLDQHNEYIKNTLDPTFKKFKVRAPKEGRLFIQCCDHDFKSTDIIGECTIDVRAQTHHSYCAAISLLSFPLCSSPLPPKPSASKLTNPNSCTLTRFRQVSDLVAGKEIDLKDYKERPEAELAKYRSHPLHGEIKDNGARLSTQRTRIVFDLALCAPGTRFVLPTRDCCVRSGLVRRATPDSDADDHKHKRQKGQPEVAWHAGGRLGGGRD